MYTVIKNCRSSYKVTCTPPSCSLSTAKSLTTGICVWVRQENRKPRSSSDPSHIRSRAQTKNSYLNPGLELEAETQLELVEPNTGMNLTRFYVGVSVEIEVGHRSDYGCDWSYSVCPDWIWNRLNLSSG